jgi:predicted CoA-binding protein
MEYGRKGIETMSKIDALVSEFLGQKKIAVVGVSDRRDTGCNANYRRFKAAGYTVYAINPRLQTFDGDPCYPDLKALPEGPDGVFILARPAVTEQVVHQCAELGIRRVWMHCLLGTKPGLGAGMTSVSPAAIEFCKTNGISVIPGSCPIQFLKPDFGHGMMRRLWRALSFLSVN